MESPANLSFSPLCDICTRIVSSTNLPEVLDLIVETAARSIGAKASLLRLLDPSGGRLEVAAAFGLSDSYIAKGAVDLEHSALDAAVLQGKIISIPQVASDPRFQYPDEAQQEGLVSVLCVPLKTGERYIGVIRVYTGEVREFSEFEKRLLYTLACHGASAIESARMRADLERRYDDLMRDVWTWYGDIHRMRSVSAD